MVSECRISIAIALVCAPVRGVEVSTDVSASREFLYLTTDVKQALIPDRLSIGAGYGLVSDWRVARQSARAAIDLELDPVELGLTGVYGPPQSGRGFASVGGRAAHHFQRGSISGESTVGLLLRRADVGAPPGYSPAIVPVGQVQIETELAVTIAQRCQVALGGLLSFYEPDLSRPTMRGADPALLITVAGRPERWAVTARIGIRISPSWRLEGGGAAVAYADGRGGAALPRVALQLGPWAGARIGLAGEVAVGVLGARGDPLRPAGALTLEYER